MRIEEKVPGGKLVCIDVEGTEGKISSIRISGDFFLHPEETIEKIEDALLGAFVNDVASRVASVLKNNEAQFIGVFPEDIERMVRKVIS